jgi:hypothetical protein
LPPTRPIAKTRLSIRHWRKLKKNGEAGPGTLPKGAKKRVKYQAAQIGGARAMRKIITGLLASVICAVAWVELVEAADPAASEQSNQIPSSSAPTPGAQGGPAGAPSDQEEAGACCKVVSVGVGFLL